MREIRQSGSEGGGAQTNAFSLPLSFFFTLDRDKLGRGVFKGGRAFLPAHKGLRISQPSDQMLSSLFSSRSGVIRTRKRVPPRGLPRIFVGIGIGIRIGIASLYRYHYLNRVSLSYFHTDEHGLTRTLFKRKTFFH